MKRWYNFKTKEYEEMERNPDDFTDYIPQSAEALDAYNAYLEDGQTPFQAAFTVLLASWWTGATQVSDEERQ